MSRVDGVDVALAGNEVGGEGVAPGPAAGELVAAAVVPLVHGVADSGGQK